MKKDKVKIITPTLSRKALIHKNDYPKIIKSNKKIINKIINIIDNIKKV